MLLNIPLLSIGLFSIYRCRSEWNSSRSMYTKIIEAEIVTELFNGREEFITFNNKVYTNFTYSWSNLPI